MATLSKFAGKKFARTHDHARAAVCCVCAKKVKDKKKGVGQLLMTDWKILSVSLCTQTILSLTVHIQLQSVAAVG